MTLHSKYDTEEKYYGKISESNFDDVVHGCSPQNKEKKYPWHNTTEEEEEFRFNSPQINHKKVQHEVSYINKID